MTLGDLTSNPHTGTTLTAQQRLGEIIDAAVLTEELGLDSYTVGEHHSSRWAITAPPVVLAAIAPRTERIRLRTGITLIPNLDPVRVAEDYATVDVLSGGRLELTVAKGNFPQPWPLFGQDREQQRERLVEGVDLLLKIWTEEPVTWEGRFRPPLNEASIGPRPIQSPPPIWWGVSTSPESVEPAVERGLPIVLGGVIQPVEHYGTLADHYREQWVLAGHDAAKLQIGSVSHLYIRKDGAQARRELEPHYRHVFDTVGKESGMSLPPFDFDAKLRGPLVCGSPDEAIEKLLAFHDRYQHQVHLFHADFGGIPGKEVAKTMELFATEVAPVLEAETRSLAPAA
ncbi:MAG TPA: LLM class flavin-dependent oxidoreductase [Gaiellaceae bacterium]|nr:LLM class flavin-dependent oxidoreductase [Gaiellaceae bacterium]